MIRLLILCLIFPSMAVADDPPAHSASHILFVGGGKLIGIRIDLSNGKQALHPGWLSFWQNEASRIDADGDKKISPEEWAKIPVLSRTTAPNEPIPVEQFPAEVAKQRGPVTLEKDAQQYYSSLTQQIVANAEVRVFDALDLDKSRKLERDELSKVYSVFRKQDLNDDDNLNREELVRELATTYASEEQSTRVKNQDQFMIAGDWTETAPVVDWLIRKLDRAETRDGTTFPSDEFLSDAEIGLGAEFGQFDQDGDQKLSRDELAKLVATPPSQIIVEVNLDQSYSKAKVVQAVHEGGPAKIRTSSDGSTTIVLGKTQIELVTNLSSSQNISSFLTQIFQNADRDNNKYLEQKEVRQDYYFRELFDPADQDKDGKLFVEELQKFIENYVGEAGVRCQIQYRDFGRDIFELLDTNRDRRLNQRELIASSEFIDRFDADADGSLMLSELGQHFRLVISGGDVRPMRQRIFFNSYTATVSVASPTGPAWFQKMDRNQDGEVSAREFLGNRDLFRKLDSNEDGLVSPTEAEQTKTEGTSPK